MQVEKQREELAAELIRRVEKQPKSAGSVSSFSLPLFFLPVFLSFVCSLCCGLSMYVLPKFTCWNLTPMVMVLGGGNLRRSWGWGLPEVGLNPYNRDLSLSCYPVRTQQEVEPSGNHQKVLIRTQWCWYSKPDFQPSELWETNFRCENTAPPRHCYSCLHRWRHFRWKGPGKAS